MASFILPLAEYLTSNAHCVMLKLTILGGCIA